MGTPEAREESGAPRRTERRCSWRVATEGSVVDVSKSFPFARYDFREAEGRVGRASPACEEVLGLSAMNLEDVGCMERKRVPGCVIYTVSGLSLEDFEVPNSSALAYPALCALNPARLPSFPDFLSFQQSPVKSAAAATRQRADLHTDSPPHCRFFQPPSHGCTLSQ